jgi:hypothetical protein
MTDQPNKGFARPWAIVGILPNAQRHVVARFRNRQEAFDYLRFMKRFLPKSDAGAKPAFEFEIVFDSAGSEYSTSLA